MNENISKLIGLNGRATGWQVVEVPSEELRGLLTYPGVMGMLASGDHSSPPQRGKYILDRFLCKPPPPPPPGIAAIGESMGSSASLTTRQLYEEHARNPACAACHKSLDGASFPFESFDASGAFRTMEKGQNLDTTGLMLDTQVANAVDYAEALSTAAESHECFSRHIYRYSFGRIESEATQCEVARLREKSLANASVVDVVTDLLLRDTARLRKGE